MFCSVTHFGGTPPFRGAKQTFEGDRALYSSAHVASMTFVDRANLPVSLKLITLSQKPRELLSLVVNP